MRDSTERWLAYAAVVAQSVLVAVVYAPRRGVRSPAAVRLAAGVLIGAGNAVATAGLVGLGRDLTASPLPPEGGRLRTGGAHAVVRHPVYAGVMVAAAARGATAGGLVRPAAAAALCALLAGKSRWEERRLRAKFPEYDAYARRTPAFIPRLGARRR